MPRRRERNNKKLKPALHIFCEGEKTEPNYFKGYINKFHPGNRRLKVIKVEETSKNTPVQLVNEAIQKKTDKATPDFDEFWVVYDRESASKYSNALHQKAYDKAISRNINIAISNVCFEVWLLLHFIDVTACYASYDDLKKNSPLKKRLKEVGIDNYDKADLDIFEKVSDNIDLARARANKMNQSTIASSHEDPQKPYLLNPFTKIQDLLAAIDNFVKKS